MLKGRELVGLPVIALETGEELGRVEDLVWEKTGPHVVGVLFSQDGLFKNRRFLELKKLKGYGPDALMVDGTTSLTTPFPEGTLHWRDCRGKKVLDTQGKELGLLEDVELEWPSGRIVGLELSLGLVDDLLEGRQTASLKDRSLTWGSDIVILH
ncbi:MAG: PRC-barrel domain-containing protein [Moorellaceae bacterium]